MSRKGMNLRVKLSLLFLFIMASASFSSYVASVLITNRSVQRDIREGQAQIAEVMQQLHQKTDLSMDELIRLSGNPYHRVRKRNGTGGLKLTERQKQALDRKETVFLWEDYILSGKTLFYLEDNLIEISMRGHSSIYFRTELRKGLTLLFSVLIGTIMIIMGSKHALRGIHALHDATGEVAKGNFDVKVKKCSDDEIGELADGFNKMTLELKSMEMLQKDFIGNVSHEFKTPISSIRGFAELIQSGELTDGERQEYAGIIREETERLSRLTSNILKLSKLENQDILSESNLFALDEQIRRVILLLEPEWSGKNIRFDLHLNDIMFYGNEEMLQQVWLNLMENAIKFSHPGGRIIIRLYHTGTSIKATVRDEGIGMDPSTRERIFDKFYQGDTTRASEGNGLGLALVKRIVDLFGGNIDVESQRGKGSAFFIELPD